ncbi:MAG: DUF4430 domain-containing protein [Clostridia bacterium]|nr:DUF4430 domain-containing protein [Clostridia bacterium]
MRKNKFKVIAVIAVCLILAVSFLLKDKADTETQTEPILNTVYCEQPSANEIAEPEVIESEQPPAESDEVYETDSKTVAENNSPQTETEAAPEATVIPTIPATDYSEKLYCTLSVSCKSVLDNIEKLKDSKKEIIPENGIIFAETKVEFFENESVFDVLNREMKNNKIQFEFVQTPMYNSVYIEGIGNLYEFDCGDTSGWLYRVNGIKPNFGCSQYQLKNGDKVEIYYSCNFFED